MIDGAILSIFPPLVAAVLTYLIANKRARLAHAKLLADMQSSAIEQVSLSEEKMRKEIWSELVIMRKENEQLRKEIDNLKDKLINSENLVSTLTTQVSALTSLVQSYKTRISELENQK